jgi:hypothetical protein
MKVKMNKSRARARVSLNYALAREALAYEKTREKPEDVMAGKTATPPGFAARIVQKVAAFFRHLFGRRPRPSKTQTAAAPVRRYRSTLKPHSIPKLTRRMQRRRSYAIPVPTGKAMRQIKRAIARAA